MYEKLSDKYRRHMQCILRCVFRVVIRAYPFITTNLSLYNLSIFTFLGNARAILLLEPNQSDRAQTNKISEVGIIFLSQIRLSNHSVCPSSVTFVCLTQPVKIFGNVSTPFCTLAIC